MLNTSSQVVTNSTRVLVAPSAKVGYAGVYCWIKAVSGTVRLYKDAVDADYVTFSDTDPLGPLDLIPGDEVWLLADTTDVTVQVLQTGLT